MGESDDEHFVGSGLSLLVASAAFPRREATWLLRPNHRAAAGAPNRGTGEVVARQFQVPVRLIQLPYFLDVLASGVWNVPDV
jgi:hypothetical protein